MFVHSCHSSLLHHRQIRLQAVHLHKLRGQFTVVVCRQEYRGFGLSQLLNGLSPNDAKFGTQLLEGCSTRYYLSHQLH